MKKLFAGFLSVIIAAGMCGCTSTETTETAAAETAASDTEALAEETAEADYSNQALTGKITAINGNSVTVDLGELSEDAGGGNAPGNNGGEKPSDKPDGNGNDSGTAPEKPSGDNSDHGQNGDAPDKPDGEADDSETPPEKPSGDDSDHGQSGNAPDKPDGNGNDSGTAPEKPSGDDSDPGQNSDVPDKPDGGQDPGNMTMYRFEESDESASFDLSTSEITYNEETISVSDLSEGDVIQITVGEDNTVTSVTKVDVMTGDSGQGSGFGGSSTVEQGTAANTLSEDDTITGETYSSTGDDENALRIDGAEVTLDSITVNKEDGASSNAETGDFYGMNAAVLATNGANVTIRNSTVSSSAQNGNGIFSYGEGTVVNIYDTEITTTADNSGGIQTTGGGTTNAYDLTVHTAGSSAAAIRSDRGGGTVNVDGGTYTSTGLNSPAVYSTADITVKNAELTAEGSEALVIEGKNSITLENCTVSGNMSDDKGSSSDENVHNIMIYQSMSGDADVGKSTLSITGGQVTSNNGDMIYVTNTDCDILLKEAVFVNNDPDSYFLRIVGNSASKGWGSAGANGGNVSLTLDSEELEGDILVDSISTLQMTLTNGSEYTGSITVTENEEGGSAVENNAVVTIAEGSTWNLTGDCTITSLDNRGTINFNGYTITLADGTVLSE